MNDRINLLIQKLAISKTKFAERLNVSQAFVSQMCAGVREPSDRTIADICREFGCDEGCHLEPASCQRLSESTKQRGIRRNRRNFPPQI